MRNSSKVISLKSYQKKKEGKRPVFTVLSLLLSLPCGSLACFILATLYSARDWVNPYIQDLIYFELIVCGISLVTLFSVHYVWHKAKQTANAIGKDHL